MLRKEKQSKLSKLEDAVLTVETLQAAAFSMPLQLRNAPCCHQSHVCVQAKTEELVKLADSVLGQGW